MKLWRRLTLCALALALLAGCAGQTPPPAASSSGPAASGSPAASAPAEEFVFTRENLPRLDGSTSVVPFAQAVCSVLLGESREDVSDLVNFSRTTASYKALLAGETDLVMAAEPEASVLSEVENSGKILMTPFATDALVFVVNKGNPVDSLTVEQVQKIYTGEITNWSQVGGEDLDIAPFQRNPEAGSQSMMEKLVMSGLDMMDPPEGYAPGTMIGLLEAVREYDNRPAAIGYTVYYYANDMEMAQGLKILAIDGVKPSAESIQSGAYPFLNPYFLAMDRDEPEDSPTRILYDWLLGPEGQALAEREGYVPVLEG